MNVIFNKCFSGFSSKVFNEACRFSSKPNIYKMTSFESMVYRKRDEHGQILSSVPKGEKEKVKGKALIYRSNIFIVIALFGAGWYIYRGKTFKQRGELDLPHRNIHKHENLVLEELSKKKRSHRIFGKCTSFQVQSRHFSLSSSQLIRKRSDNIFREQGLDPDQNLHANPVHLRSVIRGHNRDLNLSLQKTLRVSILGIPNSGKSTLVNALTKTCVRPVSKKAHTTRFNAKGVLTVLNTQIYTPGVVGKEEVQKFRLRGSLLTDPESSGMDADLFIVLQDVSNRYIREFINPEILKILCLYPEIPSILVLNKLDTIPTSKRIYNLIRKLSLDSLQGQRASTEIFKTKEHLISKYFSSPKNTSTQSLDGVIIKDLKGWPGFRDIFTISALNGTGVDKLRSYLLETSKPGPHLFPSEIKTDLDTRRFVKDIIKSKLLDFLPYDIPYLLDPIIDFWKLENEVLRICATINSTHPRITSQILRKHRLREIALSVEQDLQNFFETDVFLNINVQVLHVSVSSSFLTSLIFMLFYKKSSMKKVLFFPGPKGHSSTEIDTIVSELMKAKKSVDLCLYLLTNPTLVKVIMRLLSLGVTVRLIVDKSAESNATGSYVDKLRQLGVFVRMNYMEDIYLMHHKFAIIDRRTVIFGSFNWTKQAADGNKESLIITDDAELVNPFIKEFDKIWSEFS
ncbi:era [Lepeophtheirus salmonis]|uniref:Era n=1 Tax=Lepeophtheirus salmonis TaxID=72036 RepID=A0A7R8D6A4_LEPSM|nr:era [Lepeophtheirus salmonis]CAF3015659.1 era [Lepeophtheirus salmonis]